MDTAALILKQKAHALIDQQPDTVSWDDLAYEMDLRASIERGLADSKAGRVISAEELMAEFGIQE